MFAARAAMLRSTLAPRAGLRSVTAIKLRATTTRIMSTAQPRPAPPAAGRKPAGLRARLMSTAMAAGVPEKYSSPAVWLHWLVGAGVVTCVATVKLSQWTPKDDPNKFGMTKGELMNIHKSTALIVAALMIPRLAVRLASKAPPLPEGSMLEHVAANISHGVLYALMIFLPASGIAMGYFGGKGLPFFNLFTIPGAETPDKTIAGGAFKRHKQAGEVLTYLVPIHIGAVGFHAVKGQNILARILP